MLVEEGILSLELTLTTPDLLDALPDLVDRYADTADVGVGTISPSQTPNGHRMRRAVPGHSDHEPAGGQARRRTPGCGLSRRADSDRARRRLGCRRNAVKIFPAETVGAGYLKHLRGPFPDLEAVPSGGVDLDATREWLDAGAVAVSIGGPLLGDALKGGDLDALRDRCRAVRAVVWETVRS